METPNFSVESYEPVIGKGAVIGNFNLFIDGIGMIWNVGHFCKKNDPSATFISPDRGSRVETNEAGEMITDANGKPVIARFTLVELERTLVRKITTVVDQIRLNAVNKTRRAPAAAAQSQAEITSEFVDESQNPNA